MDMQFSISSPVCGLRPFRAERSRTSNVPNPSNWTFSSLASVLEIVSNMASTALAAKGWCFLCVARFQMTVVQ